MKANILQNYLYINLLYKNVSFFTAISKTSQEQDSEHVKKVSLQKDFVDSYHEVPGEKHS